MKIRKAKISDSKIISGLIQETLEQVNSNDYTSEQIKVWKKRNTEKRIRDKIQNKRRYECVAVVGDEIIGYGSLKGKELPRFFITDGSRYSLSREGWWQRT